MKSFAVFALASTIAFPAIASAQAAAPAPAAQAGAAVSTGATVYDTSGGVVGTVDTTDGTNAVVNTGTVKAAIPLSSLGKGEKGPVLAMTKAQLEAAAGQQQAQASADFKAKLAPGATVYGTGGTQLGTIKSADASFVTVTTPSGDAKLPIAGFGPGPQGVTLGMTAAQLQAAMGGAAATAPTASATTATDATATAATTATPPAKPKKK
ncbi:hypothetical protein [Sphingomonas adhaesiva]|uniref:hypothetical protein n=1 Tax=Sphingomonas adhaesiva TaxID=28212 RepID=UPI002FF65E09